MVENNPLTPPELVAVLGEKIQDFIDIVDAFPAELREQALFGEFSAKDILAHLSGWNLLTALNVMVLKLGWSGYWWVEKEELDAFNLSQVAQRSDKPWEVVYTEFVQSSWSLLAVYGSLSPEHYIGSYWPEAGYTVLDAIRTDAQHLSEHAADIAGVFLE